MRVMLTGAYAFPWRQLNSHVQGVCLLTATATLSHCALAACVSRVRWSPIRCKCPAEFRKHHQQHSTRVGPGAHCAPATATQQHSVGHGARCTPPSPCQCATPAGCLIGLLGAQEGSLSVPAEYLGSVKPPAAPAPARLPQCEGRTAELQQVAAQVAVQLYCGSGPAALFPSLTCRRASLQPLQIV